MKTYFAFLLFVAVHVHATTPPEVIVKPSPPTCVAELFAHESWAAARMAEVEAMRAQFADFKRLGQQDGETVVISSSADTIVQVESLDRLDRRQMESEVRTYKGVSFDSSFGNAVQITVKSRPALDAFLWFLTARNQSLIYDYMERARAVRLIIVIEAPTGRHTTQLAVFRQKPTGLIQLAKVKFTPPERIILVSERRVRAHIPADDLAVFLIDGETQRSNDEFGQTTLAIRAIREQMGLDLGALDTSYQDTASIAARELLRLAGYVFDPYATDNAFFKPTPLYKNIDRPADEDFFKKSIAALRTLSTLSYVWIDPRRAKAGDAPVPPGPVGWVTREDYARWTPRNLKSGFVQRSLTEFEGAERPTILAMAVQTVQALGYVWHEGWVKQEQLR